MRKREIIEKMDESEWIYLRSSKKMFLLYDVSIIYHIYLFFLGSNVNRCWVKRAVIKKK